MPSLFGRTTRAATVGVTVLLAGGLLAGCGGEPDPQDVPPTGTRSEQEAARVAVVSDAQSFVAQLGVNATTTATYPETSQEALTLGGPLTDGNRIASYANHGNTNVVVCVVNDTYGAWARVDYTTGVLGSGSGADAEEIINSCAAGS